MIKWQCKTFPELTNEELYKILQLRNEVFVVEQKCPYLDCDNKDFQAHHVTGWDGGLIVAYSRLLGKGISFPDAASIGRVLTAPEARKKNIGKELMRYSIDKIYALHGAVSIKISAQLYLRQFYEGFSFVQRSGAYDEDGIPHIMMEKIPSIYSNGQ